MAFRPNVTNEQINSQQSVFSQYGQAQPETTGRPLAQRQAENDGLFHAGEMLDISGMDGVREPEYKPLPAGIYDVSVTKITYKDYMPTRPDAKLPACDQMVVNLKVLAPDGREGFARANFFFTKKSPAQVKKLYDFYVSVGAMKAGDTKIPVGAEVEGAVGRAKIVIHEYNGKQYNEVHYFIAPPKDDLPF